MRFTPSVCVSCHQVRAACQFPSDGSEASQKDDAQVAGSSQPAVQPPGQLCFRWCCWRMWCYSFCGQGSPSALEWVGLGANTPCCNRAAKWEWQVFRAMPTVRLWQILWQASRSWDMLSIVVTSPGVMPDAIRKTTAETIVLCNSRRDLTPLTLTIILSHHSVVGVYVWLPFLSNVVDGCRHWIKIYHLESNLHQFINESIGSFCRVALLKTKLCLLRNQSTRRAGPTFATGTGVLVSERCAENHVIFVVLVCRWWTSQDWTSGRQSTSLTCTTKSMLTW